MKLPMLLLMAIGTMSAQTAKLPEGTAIDRSAKQEKPPVQPATGAADYGLVNGCKREGDPNCVFIIGTTTDAHGCQQWTGFEWDEGSGTCRTNLIVSKQPEVVTCSPLGKPDAEGNQYAVCWYTPKPAATPEPAPTK